MRRTIHLCQRGLGVFNCIACGEANVVNRDGGVPAVCLNHIDWDTVYIDNKEYRRCTDPVIEVDRLKDRRRPAPTERGWYWAEWRIPEDGTHDEDKFVRGGPEIVEVWAGFGGRRP